MAWSAIQLNANGLYQAVNQAHSFSIGDVVRYDSASFVKAQANSEANAEVVGIISNIPDANSFYVTQMGFVSGITSPGSLTPGTLYYLSPSTAGLLTATKPTAAGQVELACFIAYTSSSGFFFANVGELIQSGPVFAWTAVTMNTSMAVNQGYLVNGGASINMLLPATSAVGDIVEIATLGTNGCVITMAGSQTVNIVDDTSSAGGTVTLEVTNGVLSGNIRLVCMTANTAWKSLGGTGIWNPA